MASEAKRIDGYRERLREIVGREKQNDSDLPGIRTDLLKIAKEVGAWTHTGQSHGYNQLYIDELVQNINQALQTWSMIDACRTAAKNQRTAVIAAIIATIAALAAWAAAAVNIIGDRSGESWGISTGSAANPRGWIAVFISAVAVLVAVVAAVIAARRLWYHALTELMRDYSQNDMVESVNRLWGFWREKCEENKDEVEGRFKEAAGPEFLSLDKDRRRVSHFYQRMAGLYAMRMLPGSSLYLHWRERNLRIIPEVIIPMEKALKESRREKLGDELGHLEILFNDSGSYERLLARMRRSWWLRRFPRTARTTWALFH